MVIQILIGILQIQAFSWLTHSTRPGSCGWNNWRTNNLRTSNRFRNDFWSLSDLWCMGRLRTVRCDVWHKLTFGNGYRNFLQVTPVASERRTVWRLYDIRSWRICPHYYCWVTPNFLCIGFYAHAFSPFELG